jgi:hypothetical protein
MEQRSICPFLALKGLLTGDVHNEPTTVPCLDAIANSTVTTDPRQQQFPSILVDRHGITDDQVIIDAFEKRPFSSIRELAKFTCISTATVDRILT